MAPETVCGCSVCVCLHVSTITEHPSSHFPLICWYYKPFIISSWHIHKIKHTVINFVRCRKRERQKRGWWEDAHGDKYPESKIKIKFVIFHVSHLAQKLFWNLERKSNEGNGVEHKDDLLILHLSLEIHLDPHLSAWNPDITREHDCQI